MFANNLHDDEFLDALNFTESDIEVYFDDSVVSFVYILSISLNSSC